MEDSDSDWDGSSYSELPRPPRMSMTAPLPPPSRESFKGNLCEAMREEFRVLSTELRSDIRSMLLRDLHSSPPPPEVHTAPPLPVASSLPASAGAHARAAAPSAFPKPSSQRATREFKHFRRFHKNDSHEQLNYGTDLDLGFGKIAESMGLTSFNPNLFLGDSEATKQDDKDNVFKSDLRKSGMTVLGDGWSDTDLLDDGILTPREDLIEQVDQGPKKPIWFRSESPDSTPANAVEAWPVSSPHGTPVSLDLGKGTVSPTDSLSRIETVNAKARQDLARRSCFRRCIFHIVTHSAFEWVAMLMVFCNAAVAGVGTDYIARNVGDDLPFIYTTFDRFFLAVFTVELTMRLIAHGWKFFSMWGWAWNVYDLLLVSLQVLEEVLLILGSSFFDGSFLFGTVLRVVRILRTIRVIRILRVMRFTEDLQVLVSCISHSMKSFSWAVSLLLLLIYVAAIYLAQSVAATRAEGKLSEQSDYDLEYWYGTMLITVLSLFQALTGGVDWNDVVRPLFDEVSWFTGMVILSWIAFALLVIMNIFTGVFVDTALRRLEEVRETAKVRHARAMFEKMDLDSSGTIRFEEISQHTGLEEVQEFFRDIDVDVSEAQALFELLDSDGSGCLDFEEFLSGCLRLQGSARSVDLLLVAKESRASFTRQAESLNELLMILRSLMAPQLIDAEGTDVDLLEVPPPRVSGLKPPELAHLSRPRTPVEAALITTAPHVYLTKVSDLSV